ncbi:MAG: hypothetical protein V1755_06600 [Chloroflexota bacterium]
MDAKLERQLKQAGIPESLWDRLTVDGQPVAEVKSKVETVWLPKGMNKTEAAWASLLDWHKSDGRVLDWWFEPFKMKLAEADPKTHRAMGFTPDFVVVLPDGWPWVVEIKGRHVWGDAEVKFKAAAERYGAVFHFVMLQKQGAGWERLLGEEWPL